MTPRFHQGSTGDETCQINSGGGNYFSVLSTVCLVSVLDFLLKKDVVDKGVSMAPTRLEYRVWKNQLLSFFSVENRLGNGVGWGQDGVRKIETNYSSLLLRLRLK